jgi:hypothetical protein
MWDRRRMCRERREIHKNLGARKAQNQRIFHYSQNYLSYNLIMSLIFIHYTV